MEKDYAEFLTKQFFGPCLVSPTRYPFNEIFIYNDVNSIKQSLDAVPRGVLCSALRNPQLILSVSIENNSKFNAASFAIVRNLIYARARILVYLLQAENYRRHSGHDARFSFGV